MANKFCCVGTTKEFIDVLSVTGQQQQHGSKTRHSPSEINLIKRFSSSLNITAKWARMFLPFSQL